MKKGKSREHREVIDFFSADFGGVGCGCLSKSSGRTISMEEYQKRVTEMCNSLNLRQRAMMKIGLDESQITEIAPICLSSYVFDDDEDNLVKIENGVAVSSQFCVSWIFFSTTQMYTYSYIFDMTGDNNWEYTKDTSIRVLPVLQQKAE